MNALLGHPAWAPLARLSYPVYLVAMTLQDMLMHARTTPSYFSHLDKVL